jgi:hypothetical protein
MPALPTRHQSIRPPLAVLLAAVATLVILGIVWLAVTWAVGSGGSSCPSRIQHGSQTETRCR